MADLNPRHAARLTYMLGGEVADGVADEYAQVRGLLACPLTEFGSAPDDLRGWVIRQYHDAETGSGLLFFCRQAESPFSAACIRPSALLDERIYEFYDYDCRTRETLSVHWDIVPRGITVSLSQPGESKLILYRMY